MLTIIDQQIYLDNHELPLTSMETALVTFLAQRPGKYIHLNRLVGAVWCGKDITDSAVYNAISKARHKGVPISTRSKVGYTINPPVEVLKPMHITVWNLRTHEPVRDYDLEDPQDVERLIEDLNNTISGVVFELSELGENIAQPKGE